MRRLVALSGPVAVVALVLAKGRRKKRESDLWTEAAEKAAPPDLR